MWFGTKIFFVFFFCGLVLALSTLPLPAEELNLQLQFQDDRSIITPNGKYHTVVEDIDIGLEDSNVCMVYNVDIDGPAVLDKNGWGEITVIHRETSHQELMDIGEFFDFAISICAEQLQKIQRDEGGPTGRPFLFLCYASGIMALKRFVVLDKQVGQTPLECAEAWRAEQTDDYQSVPLAYAGRLDPMASGKLLILIGDECKRQEQYHDLDKEYKFTVLLGAHSDSGDVLGLVTLGLVPTTPTVAEIKKVTDALVGEITLPYPIFSAKPVKGKPLHTWAVEGRLNEIEIPTKTSTVYSLTHLKTETINIDELYTAVIEKINLIPKVTDERKALGNDFRRDDVRASWKAFQEARTSESYTLLTFRCRCSSGTYMRSLAEVIGEKLGSNGLAYSIHRTKIGHYHMLPFGLSVWYPRYF